MLFLLLSTTGLLYNYVIRGHISGTPASMLFDLFAYFFIAVSVFTLEIVLTNSNSTVIWEIIKKIYIITLVLH